MQVRSEKVMSVQVYACNHALLALILEHLQTVTFSHFLHEGGDGVFPGQLSGQLYSQCSGGGGGGYFTVSEKRGGVATEVVGAVGIIVEGIWKK